MSPIDQRNVLDEAPFEYRVFKDMKLEISWHNKPVMMLKGKPAQDIIKKIEQAKDSKSVQLILAKVTGQFKHGNEKQKSNKGF